MFLKKLFFCTLFFFTITLGHAQDDVKDQSFTDRLFVGGGAGLRFGDITLVQATPIIGYRITNRFQAGVGITYIYLRDNVFKYQTSVYGGKLFSRYYFIPQLFGHTEYEQLSLETISPTDGSLERIWAPGFLVGGGYQVNFGANSGFFMMLLIDLIQHPAYPYNNPILRGGVTFGL